MSEYLDWLQNESLGLVRKVRPSQVEMAEHIHALLCDEEKHISFIEGGTGIGKSYAYLLPIIFWAKENNKRVIISTAQKTLQTQLFEKDLPNLINKIGHINYSILKGKKNYACKIRVIEAEKEIKPFIKLPIYPKFKEWLEKSNFGDLESFDEDLEFKKYINIEECIFNKCAQKNKCGYLHAKEKAKSAKILVVNHALLALDIQLGGGKILNEYDALVIDEAHKVSHFLRDAYTLKLFPGVISYIEKLLENINITPPHTFSFFKNSYTRFMDRFQNLDIQLYDPDTSEISKLNELLQKFQADLNIFNNRDIEEEENLSNTKYEIVKKQLGDCIDKLTATFNVLINPYTEETDYLLTIEKDKHTYIKAVPIEINNLVAPVLQNGTKILFTSATLSASGNFSFFMNELGIYKDKVLHAKQFESSFDYLTHSILYIPHNAPSYDYEEQKEWYEYQKEEITTLIKASNGGAFILCASRFDLHRIYKDISPTFIDLGIPIRVQSSSVEQDIEFFKNTPNTILMGLNSLWEGVDVPGLALRLVIIPRLPFPNKSDLLLQAQKNKAIERMIEKGAKERDASFKQFLDFDLALTSIMLAQGAGRLIRTENDFGVVAVLDNRLYGNTKKYSSFLRKGLPHPICYDKHKVIAVLGALSKKASQE